MTATSPSTQCTRNRKKDGQRCRLPRTCWSSKYTDMPDPKSCAGHLNPEEGREYRRMKELYSAEFDRWFLPAYSLPHVPACHGWPEPEEVAEPAVDNDWIRSHPSIREGLRLLNKMRKWQAERCAICGHRGAAVEDHCHRTGLFRGFLCRSCNTREGLSPATVFEAYRRRPPAVIVGYTYQYVGFGTPDTGAEPEDWVVAALGPLPPDHTPEAAAYLAAAAVLDPPPPPIMHLGL